MTFTPIALFVYNRPWHTKQTIEALKKNEFAISSDLIIFSDAPKTLQMTELVDKVRKYIKTIEGFKSVTVIERKENYGLAKSIIDGVTMICKKYGRLIIIEDDLVTSPYFLTYMNAALDKYETEDKVMHISGYLLPVSNIDKLTESFFVKTTSSWGWATWKRAWDYFEPDATNLLKIIEKNNQIYEFNLKNSIDYMQMLKKQHDGKIDSWAIRWYASVFLNDGLCLFPNRSLIKNVGHDGSGVHCSKNNIYDVEINNIQPLKFPKEVKESKFGLEAMIDFYKLNKESIYKKIWRFLKKNFG
jgi:GT2 family glycosyltransferase